MKLAWMKTQQVLRDNEAEGAGGNGAGDAEGGGAAGGTKEAGAGDAGKPPQKGDPAPVQSGPYVPEGLPEQFHGTNERETIDKLWGEIHGRQTAPEKADDYTLALPDDLAPLIDVDNDVLLPEFRAIAKELGLTQQQYEGTITQLYSKMVEKGLVEKPLDLNAEFAAISNGTGDKASQISAGQKAVKELDDTFQGLATRQQISKETAAELSASIVSAASYKALAELVQLLPKQVAGLAQGGQPTGSDASPPPEQASLSRMYPTMHQKSA